MLSEAGQPPGALHIFTHHGGDVIPVHKHKGESHNEVQADPFASVVLVQELGNNSHEDV